MPLQRLIRKLEGLNDEARGKAIALYEEQTDLLLTIPACCREGVYRHPLYAVDQPPDAPDPPQALAGAARVASDTAAQVAERRRVAEERAWLTRSRRLAATVQATAAAKLRPAKVATPRRRLTIVRRARSG